MTASSPAPEQRVYRLNPQWAGLIAFILVLVGLNRPAITIDEPLDVAPGRHYWDVLAKRGSAFFTSAGVKEAFGGNPDHPPLARWLIGATSHLLQTIQVMETGQGDPTGLYIHSGRIASALAFALTVLCIARFVNQRSGLLAGWCAAFAYLFLPHVFAHAHLAALESVLNLTWTLALVAWLRWSESPSAPKIVLASICTALAMLTKLQGWLLLPWCSFLILFTPGLIKHKTIAVTGLAASAPLWLLGWPWMWYDSAARLKGYFASSVDRLHLKVLYFGQVYTDNELPWHFSLVQFLAAITPVVFFFFLLGFIRTIRLKRRNEGLWIVTLTFYLLIVFSMKITRYDMDRLFLVIWPGVAILCGTGGLELLELLKRLKFSDLAASRVINLLLCFSIPAVFLPSPVSYVSPLVGGLKFFDSKGMDLNYWGDAADAPLIDRGLSGSSQTDVISVVPTLHANQAFFYTPNTFIRAGVIFRDQANWRDAQYLVVYRRPSYWPEGFDEWLKTHEPIALRSRNGVWLAGVWPGPRRPAPISQSNSR